MSQEIPVPEGYEEVPAGEPCSDAQYQCPRCKGIFVAAHYSVARFATGRTISCCGEPSRWIRNVKRKSTAPNCPECGKNDSVSVTLGHGHPPFRCSRCDCHFDKQTKIPCEIGDHVCDHQYKEPLDNSLLCRSKAHKANCPFKESV